MMWSLSYVIDLIVSIAQLTLQFLIILFIAKVKVSKLLVLCIAILVNLIYDNTLYYTAEIPTFSMLATAIWLVLLMLSYLLAFRQSLLKSVIMALSNLFIVYSIDCIINIIIAILGEDIARFFLNYNFIYPRLLSLAFQVLSYIIVNTMRSETVKILEQRMDQRYLLAYLFLAILFIIPIVTRYQQKFIDNSVLDYTFLTNDLYNLMSYVVFFCYNIIFYQHIINNAKSSYQLEMQKLYAETSEKSLNELRGFKHDFANIINSIGGYLSAENIDDLEAYLVGLNHQFLQITTTDIANVQLKDNPFLYGIVISKMSLAEMSNVEFRIMASCNIALHYCEPVDLSRIIGILLDNAIEAAAETNNREVDFEIFQDYDVYRIVVRNTCQENIDINKIYENGYTNKPHHQGIGLAQIRKIIDKYQKRGFDMQLYTKCENKVFSQTLVL